MRKNIYILTLITFFVGCVLGDKQSEGQPYSFEKIIFHTTGCFGSCPTYHIEIKSNKSFKLFAERVLKHGKSYEIDSTKTGYFYGTVNDTIFESLNNELMAIGLDTLKFDGADCCDGSLKTVIVYYDGKRRFLRSMFPPDNAKKLIAILSDICEKGTSKRTSQKFVIENEKSRYDSPGTVIIKKHIENTTQEEHWH